MTADGFCVDKAQLYRIWKTYVTGLSKGVPAPKVIESIRTSSDVSSSALDFFACVGLNSFLKFVAAGGASDAFELIKR